MDNYKIQDLILSDAIADKTMFNCLCSSNVDFRALLNNKESFLHTKELEFFAQLKHQRRQQSYLQGRYAAKLALSHKHPNINLSTVFIDRGVFGFPVIASANTSGYKISISHSADLAVALAYEETYPMAVDIEQIAEHRSAAIKSQMLPEELAFATDIKALTRLWTAKESLAKVLNCGLNISFELLQISNLTELGDKQELSFKHFPNYKCNTWQVDNCIIAITAPTNSTISIYDNGTSTPTASATE